MRGDAGRFRRLAVSRRRTPTMPPDAGDWKAKKTAGCGVGLGDVGVRLRLTPTVMVLWCHPG